MSRLGVESQPQAVTATGGPGRAARANAAAAGHRPGPSAKWVVHISAYLAYKFHAYMFYIFLHVLEYFCIFFIRSISLDQFTFLHFCIFFVYFCIFLHIFNLHILHIFWIAYIDNDSILNVYNCIYLHG